MLIKKNVAESIYAVMMRPKNVLQVVEYLLSRGVDVNISGSVGDRPLHLAADRGDYKVVQLLLRKGARGQWL